MLAGDYGPISDINVEYSMTATAERERRACARFVPNDTSWTFVAVGRVKN